jgi:hypothetical protein
MDICSQRISDPECNIMMVILHTFRCPHGKGEQAQTFWKTDRPYRVEMDPGILFIPILGIDMNLITFSGHSSTKISQISFGSSLLSRELSNGRGKS